MFYITLVNLGYNILDALFCQFNVFCAREEFSDEYYHNKNPGTPTNTLDPGHFGTSSQLQC